MDWFDYCIYILFIFSVSSLIYLFLIIKKNEEKESDFYEEDIKDCIIEYF